MSKSETNTSRVVWTRRRYYREILGMSETTGWRYERDGILDPPDIPGSQGCPCGFWRDRVESDVEKIKRARAKKAA